MTRNGAVGADRRPLFLMEQRAEAFGHPQVVRLDQPALEIALRATLAALPSVRVLDRAIGADCLPVEDLDGLPTGAVGTVTAVRPDRFLSGVLDTRQEPA